MFRNIMNVSKAFSRRQSQTGNLVSCGRTVDVVLSKRLKLTLSITDVEARRGEKLTPC